MRRDYFLIVLLGALLFLPWLGSVHLFDWDEINFAECAREMVVTGDYMRPQIDFEPFWEKPPLFLWMQTASMSVFGVNEFAARFPNAICGILTLLVVYHIGRTLHDRLFGWIWVLAWIGSLLPHLYFRSGIIDPWFNLLIFAGLYGFIEFRWRFFSWANTTSFWTRYRHLLLGGVILGLAILTKGPTALLIAFLVLGVYWAKYRFKMKNYAGHVMLFGLAGGAAALVWFGIETALHGAWFIEQFITYQIRLFQTEDAGHGGFLGYHFVVLLFGCFPAAAFALPNLWGDRQSEEEMMDTHMLIACKRSDMGTWMQILFWVVLILFSLVKTKIVHYSSLAYFPLTYLASVTLWRAFKWDVFPRISGWILLVVGGLLSSLLIALPWLGMHPEVMRQLMANDPFALANLEAHTHWSWIHIIPGILMLAASVGGFILWNRQQAWPAAQMIFIGGTASTAFLLMMFVKNIEAYSQLAAIEFYKQHQEEDCYIKTLGFKSYAHLFYSDKKPPADCKKDDAEVLMHGKPEKKVYFVAKITTMGDVAGIPGCRELYRKNGFVFMERLPE